jgi:SAM-dependent methyltransferase
VAVPDIRERWRTSLIEATAYDWAVEHEQIAGVLGRLIWGTDTSAFYRDIARLSELPADTRVLDIPCGGGVAFRGLTLEQELHYVAADLSPVMLRRARAEAERRGIHWIEFVEADVEALPFEDRSFDLVVTYTGLHCFPDPPAAIREMARVLKPGGELRGTTVLRRAGIRQEAFVRAMQLGGVFGPGQTLAELETSLADAGLVKVSISRNGALAYFSARRRGGSRAGTATPSRGRDRLGTDTQLAAHDTMRGARDGRRDV